MTPTLKAIIARNDNNLAAAALYCTLMAHDYPRLAAEYTEYFYELSQLRRMQYTSKS